MMFKQVFISSLIVFALNKSLVWASGHTLGNGGDIAELQMISIWSTLDERLKPCMTEANPCGLNLNEMSFVNQLISQYKTKPEIEFIASQSHWEYQTQPLWGSKIKFNRRALYQLGAPKKYGYLARMVMEALFFQIAKNSEMSSLLAEKIAKSWFIKAHEMLVFINEYKVSLFFIDTLMYSQFFIDFPNEAIDLSALFLNNNLCLSIPFKSHIFRLSTLLLGNQIQLRGKIKQDCSVTESVYADFILSIPFSSSKPPRIIKPEVDIDFFYIEKINN